jgi:hypothetical protein
MSTAWRVMVMLVCAAAWLMPAADASADGKVFARATAVVNIPDQEALIHYADGVETLVIETRFEPPAATAAGDKTADGEKDGEMAAYAWVVPVPGPRASGGGGGVPEVFATTTGVFPTLRAVCAPSIRHNVPEFWIPLLLICVLILGVSSIEHWVLRLIVLVAGLLMLTCLLLPSMGKARGIVGGGDGIEVHSRSLVGSFDVAVVGAESVSAAAELQEWLKNEGFNVPVTARSVIADYAADGWLFVAAKLRGGLDVKGGPLTPHPLAVRFKATSAVYPMRLTAVENGPLSLDLYVFGEKQAVVPGMKIVRCANVWSTLPEINERSNRAWGGAPGAVPVGHRQLQSLIGGAPVVTKLSGVFRPEQMRKDLVVAWSDPGGIGAWKYSPQGASTVAANVITPMWLAAIVGVYLRGACKRLPCRRIAKVGMVALVPSLCVGLIVRLCLPTVEVTVERGRGRRTDSRYLVIEAATAEGKRVNATSSIEDFRTALRSRMESIRIDDHWYAKHPLPAHEDSPDNYLVREAEDGSPEVVVFDSIGREEIVWGAGKAK